MNSLNLYALSIMDDMHFYPEYYGALSGERARVYKPHEAKSLKVLVEKLMESGASITSLDNFFYGYIIPQIGKEFDILKIGKQGILNIELKSFINNIEDVREQLLKNRFYLAHLGGEHYFFTFNSSDGKVYRLNKKDELEICSISHIISVNNELQSSENVDIDKLFAVNQFIVSPITHPQRFLNGEYFLTQQQQIIKKKITEAIYGKKSSVVKLSGGPGTGKTLLLYDIAKTLAKNRKICFVLWKKPENSHKIIGDKFKNITFMCVSQLENFNFSGYDLIITDETQRYTERQFENVLEFTKKRGNRGIIAFEKQEIHFDEKKTLGEERMRKVWGQNFVLSGRIRVNDDLNSFTLKMFDKQAMAKKSAYKSINVIYSGNKAQTETLVSLYQSKGYNHIVPFGRGYLKSENFCILDDSVGREFQKVVVVVKSGYSYNKNGKLSLMGAFPEKLYLAVTRARSQLALIIENNDSVFDYLIGLKCKNNK